MLNPSAVAPGLLRWYSRHYLEGEPLEKLMGLVVGLVFMIFDGVRGCSWTCLCVMQTGQKGCSQRVPGNAIGISHTSD